MLEKSTSRSPNRSLKDQISSLGGRISRRFSSEGAPPNMNDTESVTSTIVEHPDNSAQDTKARSVSRGREFQSSGRGGLGNIRQTSVSREPAIQDEEGPWAARGRDPAQTISTGRGGAGNIRSPSRGPQLQAELTSEADYEREVIKKHQEASQNAIYSSGRGGAGNISASRSRSRGPGLASPALHSTGRGGAGNIRSGGSPSGFDTVEEDERRLHAHEEGIHSTGRGGIANMSYSPAPGFEDTQHLNVSGEHISTGRGGAGNIRDRSGSRGPAQRSPSKDKHGIAALWNKMSLTHSSEHGDHSHQETKHKSNDVPLTA